MELTTVDVARWADLDERSVQRAALSGGLPVHRQVGRALLFDDAGVLAWLRSAGRGRRWSDEVRAAAFALLESGSTTRLSASERSRLRANLRRMTVAQLAHVSGGLGGVWARYRRLGRPLRDVTPLDLRIDRVVGTPEREVVAVSSLDAFEARNLVVLDADGDLGVIERADGTGPIRRLLDVYLLGDARASGEAERELSRRMAGRD